MNQPRQIIAPRPIKSMEIPHGKSHCGTTRFRKHPQNRVLDGARAISPSPTVEDRLDVLKDIHTAADPPHFQPINAVVLSEAEVEAHAEVALVSLAGTGRWRRNY
jgi:hypothetical protein